MTEDQKQDRDAARRERAKDERIVLRSPYLTDGARCLWLDLRRNFSKKRNTHTGLVGCWLSDERLAVLRNCSSKSVRAHLLELSRCSLAKRVEGSRVIQTLPPPSWLAWDFLVTNTTSAKREHEAMWQSVQRWELGLPATHFTALVEMFSDRLKRVLSEGHSKTYARADRKACRIAAWLMRDGNSLREACGIVQDGGVYLLGSNRSFELPQGACFVASLSSEPVTVTFGDQFRVLGRHEYVLALRGRIAAVGDGLTGEFKVRSREVAHAGPPAE